MSVAGFQNNTSFDLLARRPQLTFSLPVTTVVFVVRLIAALAFNVGRSRLAKPPTVWALRNRSTLLVDMLQRAILGFKLGFDDQLRVVAETYLRVDSC